MNTMITEYGREEARALGVVPLVLATAISIDY